MTPEQAIRESYIIAVDDSKPDVKWFAEFVRNAKDPWKITRLLVWLLRRSNNQSVELGRAAEALANHSILRQALEEIAEPHGCGCPEICRCFSGEGGREIAEAMREIAVEALKNVPPKAPVKASQVPPELYGVRVGAFTLSQAPEGFKSRPVALREGVAKIPDMDTTQLVSVTKMMLVECSKRGITITGTNIKV